MTGEVDSAPRLNKRTARFVSPVSRFGAPEKWGPGSMKNEWSLNAAALGVFVTILLLAPTDIPPVFVVGLFCPPPIILGRVLDPLHVGFSSWMYFLLIPVDAAGNAIWYMLLAETFRLLMLHVRSKARSQDV
jgi:hypothetical protein